MNALVSLIERVGTLSARDAAAQLAVSVVTISRYAKAAGSSLLTLGRGQHTRYALPYYAYSDQAQWPLFWVGESGEVSEFALASLVKPSVFHLYGSGLNLYSNVDLTWPLTPLHLRGFLGRAQRALLGAVATNWVPTPESWPVAQRVFAAQSATLDHAGAVLFGQNAVGAWQTKCLEVGHPDDPTRLAPIYDRLADEASAGRVAGSSADGEQPKFSARITDPVGSVRDVLVKFSPPLGTPFGDRWNDLLRAEAHAASVLALAGFDVPHTRVIASQKRTYLESARIDRVGACGRRHLLPLGAVHAAFVTGAVQNWTVTLNTLWRMKRLPFEAVVRTQVLFIFGHLIGNSDMHFGNLGVIAKTPELLARGQFELAPVYDMLPMRFAPNPYDDFGYTHFTPVLSPTAPKPVLQRASELARIFWQRNATDQQASAAWNAFADQRMKLLA